MILDEKIRSLETQIEDATERKNTLSQEIRDLLDGEKPSEDNVKQADEKAKEVQGLTVEIKSNNESLASYKAVANNEPAKEPAKDPEPVRALTGNNVELRNAQNEYLKVNKREFRANETLSGLVSPDVGVTIPEDISYNPDQEIHTVTDLMKLVYVFPAKTASGKYPVAKKVTDSLVTAEELEKNPELAKPQFKEVDWKVDTYRGALPLSQESIDDSVIDLVSFVGQQAVEKKVNTTNRKITDALKTFTAKSVAGESVDDLKKIINVDLDKAYKRDIVVTQSFYNYLDTLKDKNGQYLLKPAISEGSPEKILGLNVYVIEDELFGAVGESHAWVGDLKRAILFANRKEIQVRWTDNDYFSQDLAEIVRFGVSVADEKAGYFLTQGTPS
ncbi:phage major capsid protein [Lactobacillus terrae]|uniref:phage major capsid protein n=1 Tax=Lactobacillus terrae TaxID=2269374 RepID=UPI000C1B67D9|nr:phage major capsid protein [Lactobacillus terrae]